MADFILLFGFYDFYIFRNLTKVSPNTGLNLLYTTAYHDETNILYLRLLNTIKDIKHIPGSTQQDIYERIKNQYFKDFSMMELIKVVSLMKDYPPHVKKIITDMIGKIGQHDLQQKISSTVLPTTRINL